MNPPLRSDQDRKALIQGVKEGIIDVIVSSHTPHDEESKKLEFDKADFGISGLQTVLPSLLSLSGQIEPIDWIEKVTNNPRSILKLEILPIEERNPANLTLIDPKIKWVFDNETNQSKAKNSPLFNQELTGKVKAVFNGDKYEIFNC